MEIDLDRIPITQLPSRYGIARSNLDTRLKDLGIEPEKMGKKAYVNAEQLRLLDALHEHIQKGGTTGEFLKWLRGDSQVETRSDRTQLNQTLATSPNEQNLIYSIINRQFFHIKKLLNEHGYLIFFCPSVA
jgi:hypothetical protein